MSRSIPFSLPAYFVPSKDTQRWTERLILAHRLIEGHIYALTIPSQQDSSIVLVLIRDLSSLRSLCQAFQKTGYQMEDFPPDDIKNRIVRNPITAAKSASASLHNGVTLLVRLSTDNAKLGAKVKARVGEFLRMWDVEKFKSFRDLPGWIGEEEIEAEKGRKLMLMEQERRKWERAAEMVRAQWQHDRDRREVEEREKAFREAALARGRDKQ